MSGTPAGLADVTTLPVLEALAATALFDDDQLGRAEIEPASGLTNRSYRVVIDDGQYMLRLPGPGTEAYIDRVQEVHNASVAADVGIAPEVLFANPQRGIQLARFVDDARTLDAEALRDPATLDGCVQVLARLHRSARPFRGEMALFPKLDQYLRLACQRGPNERPRLDALRRRAEGLRLRFEAQAEPPCPCHIDPTPANFLMTAPPEPRLYLVDWEYSASCEPTWDLADLAAEAEFSEEQDARLLSCYYGRVTAEHEDRFVLFKALLHLLAAAWGAAQRALGNDSPAVEALISFRTTEAERLLELILPPP